MRYLRTSKGIEGRTCLLRLDLNTPDGELKNSLRVQRAVPTIRYLLERGCRVVILSHRGRPEGKLKVSAGGKLATGGENKKLKVDRDVSLKPAVRALGKLIGRNITLFDHFDFKKIKAVIDRNNPGTVFALENIRLLDGEERNSTALAKKLARVGDFFVNDAFAASHRAHASVDVITRFLVSYAGLSLEEELKACEKVMRHPRRPLVVIIGGAKVSDKIGVVENFGKRASAILVGGGTANAFLTARGLPVGESVYERRAVTKASYLLKSCPSLVLPTDVVVHGRRIVDIGTETIRTFSRIIQRAGTVIWSGPMGIAEKELSARGTLEIACAITRCKAFSLVGGGQTTAFIIKRGLYKKFSFLSTGGGALLEYLAGKKLPGIEALATSRAKSPRSK